MLQTQHIDHSIGVLNCSSTLPMGQLPTYSQFACIGSGFSAIGLGATLKRRFGITDVRFFERHKDLGGTWFINTYPGSFGPNLSHTCC